MKMQQGKLTNILRLLKKYIYLIDPKTKIFQSTLKVENRTQYVDHQMSNAVEKQSSRGVLKKRCSENMQQIYKRTPMAKCDFDKVTKQLYWNYTSAWVFSCTFSCIFSEHLFLGTHLDSCFWQLKIKFIQRNHYTRLWTECFIWLYEVIVSLSARIIKRLYYDMRKEQTWTIVNIGRRLVPKFYFWEVLYCGWWMQNVFKFFLIKVVLLLFIYSFFSVLYSINCLSFFN